MPNIFLASTLTRQLFNMTLPMVFGIFSLMSFQLVDSIFIGQLGVLPLASQGFTLPIQMLIIGFQVGLGIATTAVISRVLGAKEITYAKQLGGLVIVIGSISMLLFCLLLWFLRYPILALLSAPENVYSIINNYWPYWLAGAWIGALTYFYYSVMRANGNTLLPGLVMTATSIFNAVLDPLFIFTLDFGLKGAAIASIVSFAIGLLVVAIKVRQNHWLSMNWSNMNIGQSIGKIVHIMGPAMLSQLLPSVSSILATKLIAGFGTAAVAAWALGVRVEFFVIMLALALTMSMPPMIGRLLGEKNTQEIRQLVHIACRFILIFQVVIALVIFTNANFITQLLSCGEEIADILTWLLKIIPISLGPLGICMMIVSASNALGKPYTALSISALRLFAFFLPCLWIGAQLADIKGLFVGVLVGNSLAGLVACIIYYRLMGKVENGLAKPQT